MISDEYPPVCQHLQCRGHAIPATWKYKSNKWGTSYYCTVHARRAGKPMDSSYGTWVQLTPNQRPVSVKE